MGPRDEDQPGMPPERAGIEGESGFDDGAEQAESVEQYVRLHDHVESLRADKRPPQPTALSSSEAEAYQVAALFRAASAGADDPDPHFVSTLLDRLEREAFGANGAPSSPVITAPKRSTPPAANVTPKRGVSRRSLLNVGLGAAAAGLAVGIGIEHSQQPTTTTPPTDVPLVSDNSGVWLAVAPVTAIPVGSVRRFSSPSIVGYVRHTASGFSALSGVCTHMGCLLQWNGGARTFDCPCHGGRFTEDGASAPGSAVIYKPLPALKTKIDGDQVWVLVASTPDPGDSSEGRPTPTTPGDGTY